MQSRDTFQDMFAQVQYITDCNQLDQSNDQSANLPVQPARVPETIRRQLLCTVYRQLHRP